MSYSNSSPLPSISAPPSEETTSPAGPLLPPITQCKTQTDYAFSLSKSLSKSKEKIETALQACGSICPSGLVTQSVSPPPPLPPPPPPRSTPQSSTGQICTSPSRFCLPPSPQPPLSPLFAPPRAFADKAGKLAKNGEQWKKKTRQRVSRPVSIETNKESGLQSVPPQPRHGQFAVYRLAENTTADEVRRHLHKERLDSIVVLPHSAL